MPKNPGRGQHSHLACLPRFTWMNFQFAACPLSWQPAQRPAIQTIPVILAILTILAIRFIRARRCFLSASLSLTPLPRCPLTGQWPCGWGPTAASVTNGRQDNATKGEKDRLRCNYGCRYKYIEKKSREPWKAFDAGSRQGEPPINANKVQPTPALWPTRQARSSGQWLKKAYCLMAYKTF